MLVSCLLWCGVWHLEMSDYTLLDNVLQARDRTHDHIPMLTDDVYTIVDITV